MAEAVGGARMEGVDNANGIVDKLSVPTNDGHDHPSPCGLPPPPSFSSFSLSAGLTSRRDSSEESRSALSTTPIEP